MSSARRAIPPVGQSSERWLQETNELGASDAKGRSESGFRRVVDVQSYHSLRVERHGDGLCWRCMIAPRGCLIWRFSDYRTIVDS